MKIIKLNAIDSTNSFLKELAQNSTLENYTTVVAKQQKNGRGQQENKWLSKPFKNLTFSIYLKFSDLKITDKKQLNFAISLAIFEVLFNKKTPKLSIKWPNDILSANKKICGILIENSIKGHFIKNAVVGIGINVNQEHFSDTIKNVTSLKNETNKEFNLDELLENKESIVKAVFEDVAKSTDKLGVKVINCGMRDVILTGDMKEIMNQVLVAQKRAQANIITRREETASTRSLLNTAKLMEDNEMLFKLKEMEYVEKIAEKVGEISVSGNGNMVKQLKEIFAVSR